jgi:hypothetical protein
MAIKAASIITKIVGFPYKAKSSCIETTAWRIFSDEDLFERKMEERFGPNSDILKVGFERYREIQKEIGMDLELSRSIYEIKLEKSGVVQFESTIMVDVWWSVENDDYHVPREKVPELDDPRKWPKWKRKIPVIITMLSKCHEAAKKASEEFGVKVLVERLEDSDDYVFHVSFDSSGMSEEQFLREIERHCKAMVKAYKMYEPWLTGSEHEKLVSKAKLAKNPK